ncbi:MAG TPA: hypothetical protein VF221_12670 [Chloroflexota bacterium]
MWDWLEKLLQQLFQALADWVTRCIPQYDPAAWNDGDGIQFNNNCYNYACNMQTGTYAQPGLASGHEYASIDCTDVGNGAVSDGLAPVGCDVGCGCRECCHQVALVIWPGEDFHWFRRDRDGRWSHKPGGGTATNLDFGGHIIADPRTANRGPYTVFCGCYCVCQGRVSIA